jgi:hypothetical protein
VIEAVLEREDEFRLAFFEHPPVADRAGGLGVRLPVSRKLLDVDVQEAGKRVFAQASGRPLSCVPVRPASPTVDDGDPVLALIETVQNSVDHRLVAPVSATANENLHREYTALIVAPVV